MPNAEQGHDAGRQAGSTWYTRGGGSSNKEFALDAEKGLAIGQYHPCCFWYPYVVRLRASDSGHNNGQQAPSKDPEKETFVTQKKIRLTWRRAWEKFVH